MELLNHIGCLAKGRVAKGWGMVISIVLSSRRKAMNSSTFLPSYPIS